jgi:hypothetical protein
MRLRLPLLATVLAACGPAATPVTTSTPLAAISAAELRTDLSAISADSLMGRETGSRGARAASKIIADRMISLGIEPAGDSMYHQRVPLVRQSFGPDTRITVRVGQSNIPLGLGTDIVPLVNLGPGAPLPRRNATGDVVFAGYGVNSGGRTDFRGITEAGKGRRKNWGSVWGAHCSSSPPRSSS